MVNAGDTPRLAVTPLGLSAALPVLLLPLATVLAADPWGWQAFTTFRWAAISTLVAVGVTAVLRRDVVVERRSGQYWMMFLGWALLCTLLSLDGLPAWIGTPQRHFGLFTWLLLAGVFFIGQQLSRVESHRLLLTTAAAAFVMGLIATLKSWGWGMFGLGGASDRIGGLFGSAAFLGAAASLLLPLCVGLALEYRHRRLWCGRLSLAAALSAVALVLSQSRAAVFGTVVAALIAAWTYRHRVRLLSRVTKSALAALLGIVIIIVALSPLGGRLSSSFDDEGGFESRTAEWSVATTVIANHPLFGVGPEGYRLAFAEGVTDSYEQRYGRAVLPDRAHSSSLDIAANFGLVGLALWLMILASMYRPIRWALTRESPAMAGLALGLVAYGSQQLLLFPLAEIDPLAWLLAGMLVGAMMNSGESAATIEPFTDATRRMLFPAAAVVTVLIASAGFADVVADHAVAQSIEAATDGDQSRAIHLANRATTLRPDQFTYHLWNAVLQGQFGDFELALSSIDRSLDRSPRDPVLLQRRASLLGDRADASSSPEHQTQALDAWHSLVDTDPTNADWWFNYGLELSHTKPEQAIEAWTNAARLAPHRANALVNIGIAHLRAARLDEATVALTEAARREPNSPQVQAATAALTEAMTKQAAE